MSAYEIGTITTTDVVLSLVPTTVGAIIGMAAYHLKVKRREEKKEKEVIDQVDRVINGGGNWMQEGVVDVLEKHDEQIEKTVEKVGTLELRIELVQEDTDQIDMRLRSLIDKHNGDVDRAMDEMQDIETIGNGDNEG